MNSILILACAGVLCMMAEVFRFKKAIVPVIAMALIAGMAGLIIQWNAGIEWFSGMIYHDRFASAFSAVILCTALLWLIMAGSYFKVESNTAEHSSIILFALCGAVLMVSYADLTVLFLGLEILSIALYILAGSEKRNVRSNEAALKYFLMGSFATGFLLFGIALIYGVAGTFNLVEIADRLAALDQLPDMIYAGIILIMVGLCFKIAAVPFHFWAPDVYEGSPTLITAFMATVVKTAAFAAFYRLFSISFADYIGSWSNALAIIAAITMLAGNILAAWQQSFKRMLAYSSIAHAGYMLMAIVALSDQSASAIFMYSVAYSLASIGSFALLHAVSINGNEQVSAFKGMSASNPLITGLMVILLLSLAGIPPVAGFFAKYYLFTNALQAGYLWLVVVAVISSLIGVYYYFRVLYTLFLPGSEVEKIQPAHRAVILITAVLSLLIGILPSVIQSIL